MAYLTFSIRISKRDHELLSSLAHLSNTTVAGLARDILKDGIRDRLDPATIEANMEAEKARLLAASAELRGEATQPEEPAE